jgi:hypothetical protein
LIRLFAGGVLFEAFFGDLRERYTEFFVVQAGDFFVR